MKIGINGTGLVRFASIEKIVADAERAMNDGFGSYWLAEHPLGGFDALTVLGTVAQRVPEIELGTAIVPTWPRHPLVLAGQALTVAQTMKGRLTLGIGLSHAVMLEQLGLTMDKPIRHLREYLSILMPLLHSGQVDFEGQLLSCRAEFFGSPESPPQVLVAALGPQALRVAGRLADGTTLAWVGPKTVREHVVPVIVEAAEGAQRSAPRIVASLPLCVTDDPSTTRARARRAFAMYGELPSYRAMLEREGVEEPADLVIAGDEVAVDAALAELAEAGVTDFSASEFCRTDEESARTRELLRRWSAGGGPE